ncbi:MAG: hypothetical protein V1723_03870 [Candidatus Uhrbacteria bacterium]
MSTFIAAHIALNDAAKALVAGARVIEIDEVYGPPDLELRIRRYELPDGRVFTEFFQDGNPFTMTIFLALKDAAGNIMPETLWPKEEIERRPSRERGLSSQSPRLATPSKRRK